MGNLTDYRKKITSQDGEDGIIETVFHRLNIRTRWCVEFDAWDPVVIIDKTFSRKTLPPLVPFLKVIRILYRQVRRLATIRLYRRSVDRS